jgi:hypothetical protein
VTGTGQKVAQLRHRYMMVVMMMINLRTQGARGYASVKNIGNFYSKCSVMVLEKRNSINTIWIWYFAEKLCRIRRKKCIEQEISSRFRTLQHTVFLVSLFHRPCTFVVIPSVYFYIYFYLIEAKFRSNRTRRKKCVEQEHSSRFRTLQHTVFLVSL